eukprot:7853308-Pyramimonas_sp.AAC.1
MWTPQLGRYVKRPMEPRSGVLVGETHVDTASGTVGGAPYVATKRCVRWVRRMWTPPLGD